ncbi:MAG: 4-hydroxyphenylpyruvate dioxygenase [Fimbriimonadaceae bacterium]|jgi:4-hydroxyphenylpyruvate dioxygenase
MQDIFPIRRIDHVRFLVGNAKQAAYFYRNALGFSVKAYRGLETGSRNEVEYLLEQGNIKFRFTGLLRPNLPEAAMLAQSGDGVTDICFEVDDVKTSYETAISRGACPYMEPTTISDEHGEIDLAAIKIYGNTIHSLINRDRYNGVFLPQFREHIEPGVPIGLEEVDHMVANVELGRMNEWVGFYAKVLGFSQLVSFDDKDISTDYTALMSKVMQNGNGRVKFPINEPAEGKKKSQIDEYLEFYGGPGVQHIAMETHDILGTIREMRNRGIEFLRVPRTYYDTVPERVGQIAESIEDLAELGILVDRDDEGYLLQIFTKPIGDRPTVFFEIIERHGAKSFGKGNFKALFEAIEREQELRGTL